MALWCLWSISISPECEFESLNHHNHFSKARCFDHLRREDFVNQPNVFFRLRFAENIETKKLHQCSPVWWDILTGSFSEQKPSNAKRLSTWKHFINMRLGHKLNKVRAWVWIAIAHPFLTATAVYVVVRAWMFDGMVQLYVNVITFSGLNHDGGLPNTSFYLQSLTIIPAWISNRIHYKVWGE